MSCVMAALLIRIEYETDQLGSSDENHLYLGEVMAISRVLIMAAGTGGHVFPALAIARQLEARGVKIDWLGTPYGMEGKLLEGTDYEFHQIAAKGLKGKDFLRLLSAPWMLMRSLWQSLVIIYRVKPDCVLGMGDMFLARVASQRGSWVESFICTNRML